MPEALEYLIDRILETAQSLLESGQEDAALQALDPLAGMGLSNAQRRRYDALARALEAIAGAQDAEAVIAFIYPEPLTLGDLAEGVVPFLQALGRLHDMLAEMAGRPRTWNPGIWEMAQQGDESGWGSLEITLSGWTPEVVRDVLSAVEMLRSAENAVRAFEIVTGLVSRYIGKATPDQRTMAVSRVLPDLDDLSHDRLEARYMGGEQQPPPQREPERGARYEAETFERGSASSRWDSLEDEGQEDVRYDRRDPDPYDAGQSYTDYRSRRSSRAFWEESEEDRPKRRSTPRRKRPTVRPAPKPSQKRRPDDDEEPEGFEFG